MSEFGHNASSGPGFHIDGWGAGPFVIMAGGRLYLFEDSDRFGPVLLDSRKPWDISQVIIPERSPFWKAYYRWRDEGRRTTPGKQIGRGEHKRSALYCLHSDLRTDPPPQPEPPAPSAPSPARGRSRSRSSKR